MCSQQNPNSPEQAVRDRIEAFLRKWPDAKSQTANELAGHLYADPSQAINEIGPSAITSHKAAMEAMKCWTEFTNPEKSLPQFFEWSEGEMKHFFKGAIDAHLTPYEGQSLLSIAVQEAEWYGMCDFWRNFEGNLELWKKALLQPQLPF
jgi:hypothetical protein